MTEMVFPKHLSLTLQHNQHENYYETVGELIAEGFVGFTKRDWVSDEQREQAIATNECWTLQWYPDTPIGFCVRSAATLDALMAWMAAEGLTPSA